MRILIFLPLLLPILASPALASDGVLEINQTCALETGCFAGDIAGWPVTVTAPGSYRLTSNLSRTLPIGGSQDASFIEISTDDVSLDLGGFRIACSNLLGAACTGIGSGVASGLMNAGNSVGNGSVVGMAENGVFLGVQAEVTNLRVRSNRLDGIFVDAGSTVSGNTAYQNGDDGVFASTGSTVSGNTAYRNGAAGIRTASGCTVRGNTVRSNTLFGLDLGPETGYRENLISTNGGTVDGGVDAGANVIDGVVTPTP